MSQPWKATEQRLLELLADRALFGLEPREAQELRQLLQKVPDFDTECMERVAATVQLACAPIEPMPAAVRDRIHASGLRHVRGPSRE
jgi:hypothetical protein